MSTFDPEDAAQDGPQLRNALGRYPTSVTVTIRTPTGKREGQMANSIAAVSLDPRLVLWRGLG